jgi:hypothetical protein
MKKAILINSENKTLSYIQLSDDYRDIYSAIGNNCNMFCCPVTFENMDTIYADDESLLRFDDIKGGFIMEDWHSPIIGNAIILGTDNEGESVDCKTTIEQIQPKIKFIGEKACKEYATIVLSTPPQIYTWI